MIDSKVPWNGFMLRYKASAVAALGVGVVAGVGYEAGRYVPGDAIAGGVAVGFGLGGLEAQASPVSAETGDGGAWLHFQLDPDVAGARLQVRAYRRSSW
jgi:hypothetical protein